MPKKIAHTVPDERSLEQRIAEKAYELYEKRGRIHGRDLDDWLTAERLVSTEPQAQMTPEPRRDGARAATIRKKAKKKPGA